MDWFRAGPSELLGCYSDDDFLAKLHCIRQAFQELLLVENNQTFFGEVGKRMVMGLMTKAEKNTKGFLESYKEMLLYTLRQETWPTTEKELEGRGVVCMNFFDIALDFILMDALEDLENPPSSVLAILRNRWLSDSFKETALATACWSVLKAKRRLLMVPDGFISHFYSVSEHVSPVLAFGFLGPKQHLFEVCSFFKISFNEFTPDGEDTKGGRGFLRFKLTKMGDFTGRLLAYLSLSPIFIIVGFVTLIVFKRELHTISFLGGLCFNEGVNWLIKNIVQEQRPCPEAHPSVYSKYAMPSSHSQFIWFFSVYSFLFLYLRMHQTNNARFLDLLWRHLLSVCLLTLACLVSCSRVYLLYHTWSQVVYGGIVGSFMAGLWFLFTQEILTPLFPRIAAWPLSEFFLIRDTSLIPNILWFEYTVSRAEARNRQRKLGTKLQ
ncbi:uncharacterized protein M6D78_015948 isoform 4-T5 [Vipera latastei]